jgi:hypothetical protein
MSDSQLRKLVRPMDARGKRGIFSRGKNVYKGTSHSPKPLDIQNAARQRLQRGNKRGPNRY